MTKVNLLSNRRLSKVNPMIYGQFAEHFHRQIYGGIYDPQSKFADEDGFRTDVIDALKKLRVPIIRWPGGCFVSAYHWKYGVGAERRPVYDKAWRVEESNRFGTDEYIKFCRKVGCEPYICTNAGTGTMEEMSDWVEYCNLPGQGWYGRLRVKNGYEEPYNVKYWSIGNENWGSWEIGSNNPKGWAHLVTESAKMMKRTDPSIELSAAALTDMDWNTELLKKCGERLSWISIHGYWDMHEGKNHLADYNTCLSYMKDLDKPVRRVRGLLEALDMTHIQIAYDEWNLRAWYHPNIMELYQGKTVEEYLYPRDDNDLNEQYTMADAVFSACFLNMCIRNCDSVGMANFSPAVNTRGMIYTYEDGIVLRSTYYVFELYNKMQDNCIDFWWSENGKAADGTESVAAACGIANGAMSDRGTDRTTAGQDQDMLDIAATADDNAEHISIAIANKDPQNSRTISFALDKEFKDAKMFTLNGPDKDSYNTVGRSEVLIHDGQCSLSEGGRDVSVTLEPHSVNVITLC